MSKYSETDRQKWADYFQTTFSDFRPVGLQKRGTQQALKLVWDSDSFWFQCAERFGFLEKSTREIDRHNLEHAAWNFWAMLREAVLNVKNAE